MTERGILKRVCRRTASAIRLAIPLLASCLPLISVLLISVLPILAPVLVADPATAAPAPAAVAGAAAVAAPTSPLTVSLTAISPTVATPKTAVKITGTVRNAGTVAITTPAARALIGARPLASRAAVSDWATTEDEPLQTMAEVAHISLGKTLLPGSTVGFSLTLPADAVSHPESFAVLPLRVEVVGSASAAPQELGRVNTFLPTLASIKAFEPMAVAWLVPLTLDPDPALHGTPSPDRTAAWARAIGPGSRLDRLIEGTQDANVTWAIDPAILGPSQTPPAVATSATQPEPTPTGSQPATRRSTPQPTRQPTQQPTQPTQPTQGSVENPDPVSAATTALAARLRAAAARHTLWSLPYADPDLAALVKLPLGSRSLAALSSHPSTLDVAVGPARADIAWPVTGTMTPQTQVWLRRAFASSGLTAAVTSSSTMTGRDGGDLNASRRSSTGLPLLAYDESLSGTVAQTASKARGAITIQRFLADSMALLGERPGTRDRSVLIAEPRTFAGDPAVLRSLFAAVAAAKWLVPATTGQLLTASEKLVPEAPETRSSGSTGTATSPLATPTPSDPLDPGGSPLTSARLATIPGTLSTIIGIGSILTDGGLFTQSWTDAQAQQLSTRWRAHPQDLTAIDGATTGAINTISRNVKVAPTRVNFFADRGVLQVTVVNNLDVPIHDVRLTLVPARPRLRIERQPVPLRIGARSRANIPLQVTSIAAGLVSVEARLATRNGTSLGQNASVNVQVQPPSSWIYRVLGALAGVILVLGTWRSLRRGSTRASRPDAQEPAIHD